MPGWEISDPCPGFCCRSIAVGGDSIVRVKETDSGLRTISIGPERVGPAYCMGGKETPTDALRVLRLVEVGDSQRANEAISSVASVLVICTGNRVPYSGHNAEMIAQAVRDVS